MELTQGIIPNTDFKAMINYAQQFGLDYGLRVLYAVLILVVGLWVARIVRKVFVKVLTQRKVEKTIRVFLSQVLYFTVLSFVLVAVLSMIGIQTASLVAVIGAIGLAISFSLRNSLSNIAAGILLIVNKPFKIGQFVEVSGQTGTVEKINLFLTTLKTSDNQSVAISNGQILNAKIVNFSDRPVRRINITVGISYDDDMKKAKKLLLDLIKKDKRFHTDPEPLVAVSELANSSVNLVFRAWVDSGNYWPMVFEYNEKIKDTFDQNDITIPYPQQDVYLHKVDA